MLEDLRFALQIAEADDSYAYAKALAERRAAYRFARLARQTLGDVLERRDSFPIRYNAECIVNNFMMALAGIFGEIHKLTSDIECWNIEFEDAGKRLTASKADKLLYFDGPYRAGNARVLLMREIMLYKG